MANIKRIEGKTGISFKITITKGRDINGKQIRHYMTWTPSHPMTEKQMQKAAEKAAFEFEQSLEQGYQIDNRQNFSNYSEYVMELKKREGVKYRTLERYQELLTRINIAIGHIKLIDIRPQHLNALYKNLGEEGAANRENKAIAKVDIAALLKEKNSAEQRLLNYRGFLFVQ